jgi:hypothetical protein
VHLQEVLARIRGVAKVLAAFLANYAVFGSFMLFGFSSMSRALGNGLAG